MTTTINGKPLLVCNCEGTMPLDAEALAAALDGEAPTVHEHLCRAQIARFTDSLSDKTTLVACTQESALFAEAAEGRPVRFTNIRERAGWSAEAVKAQAKIAALLAEAALDLRPTPALTLASGGVTVVYGRDETAIEAARQLAGRLAVTCILARPAQVEPPRLSDVPLFKGVVRQASGHLGAFELVLDEFAAPSPSSRAALAFPPGREGEHLRCDLLLDLSGGAPMFPAKRDGYFRVDAGDPARLQRALFELTDMVGEFEKPRYVRVDATICAHSRNSKTGCTRCLDLCPSGAITPAGDHVSVDPHICCGHGACASACPTGAIAYDVPAGNGLFDRLRVLLGTYRKAGGERPVLLVHDATFGDEMIGLMARHGRGLPAHVLPFAVNEATQVGFDLLVTALAYGAAQVRLLAGRGHRFGAEGVDEAVRLADIVAQGLGYGGGRVSVLHREDPLALEADLYDAAPTVPAPPPAADYLVLGERKRTTLWLALRHLHEKADTAAEVLPLPAGAPFGAVLLDREKCTLCLSCVGACPVGALHANPDKPELSFSESICVQCGLCRATCPEDAIALEPRLDFRAAAAGKVVLKEEEPFHCIRCGKPFGTAASIERMVGRLADHSMFRQPGRLDLVRMCQDCRVTAQFELDDNPLAGAPRPKPRTTDDYLQARGKPPGA